MTRAIVHGHVRQRQKVSRKTLLYEAAAALSDNDVSELHFPLASSHFFSLGPSFFFFSRHCSLRIDNETK